MLAALMIHGIAPGPLLMEQQPHLVWGFIASMYVGNIVLLVLNLPMVGLFVNLLRIPYAYLYPAIVVFCVIGVYAVSSSTVDIWIMFVMGGIGYLLRKLEFDMAPVVLGLVLAPMLELSLRQSLAMSAGSYAIFIDRPIALAMLAVVVLLLAASLWPVLARRGDWRSRVGLDEKPG
jgi:putative tricarboxylic transport membrane protein